MKNKNITLNGKEYIEIEEYNKLKDTKIKLKDYAALEPTNCWGIFPFINKNEDSINKSAFKECKVLYECDKEGKKNE